jgi:hypothetical protein
MQYIDPYNDDFFKKAAEDYPLRTNGGEWESVAKKLNSTERKEIATRINYKNIRQRSAMICTLLLIPFAIAVTKYFNDYKVDEGRFLKNFKNAPLEKNPIKISNEINIRKRVQNTIPVAIDESGFKTGSNEKISNELLNLSGQNKIEKQKELNNPSNGGNVEIATNNILTKDNKKVLNDVTENINIHGNADRNNAELNTNKYKGFYIGGAIAPELTSVKLQPARKSFDIGLLMGYNLNKNLSIELGIMLAQKYYYTSGKYVVPNTMGPRDSKIIAVNAFNSITEMPLTLQYNLKNENNARVFVSAGAVSYIVHKENYSYTYSKDGEEMHGRTLNNKASQNWFSNVQMSLGYERSFNKICNIRIEPYCRIPLKGIGIGDLPVTSGGVNLALIKIIK